MTTTDAPPTWAWTDAIEHLEAQGVETRTVETPELGPDRAVVVRALSRGEVLKITRIGSTQPDQSKADCETLVLGIVSPKFTNQDYGQLKMHPSASKIISRLSKAIADLTAGTDSDAEGDEAKTPVAQAEARFRGAS